MASNSVVVNGLEFNSKREACKYFGVSDSCVRKYVREKNVSFSEAIDLVIKSKDSKIYYGNSAVVVNGKEFENKKEACEYFGVKEATVNYRLRQGLSLEEALSKSNLFSVVVDGKEFKSKSEACEYFGVNEYTVYDRIKSGMSLEEAIMLPIKVGRPISIKVNGMEFVSIKEACEYYGVSEAVLSKRRKKGWSIEEAFELVPKATEEGYIDSKIWNKLNCDVKIIDYINNVYKCEEVGNIRYYSEGDMLEKFKRVSNVKKYNNC